MTTRCSHCSNNGHNTRTCPARRRPVLVFGVHLMEGVVAMKESASMGSSSVSHDPRRKKGIPWTEEEHRMFLMGLKKLGKGNWRGIALNFVMSRTPTQVASHAQKYYIRRNNQWKRRTSVFDQQLLPPQSLDADPAEPSRTKLAVESYPTSVIAPVSSWPRPPNLDASSSIGGSSSGAMAEPRKEQPVSKLSIADGGRMETLDLSLRLMVSSI